MERSSKEYRMHNTRPKTQPCGTPDTTLTSLVRQPSTITCCNQFDKKIVSIDNTTEPPIPKEQSLWKMPWWGILSMATLKSICTILASCPLSNALCSAREAHKTASHVHINRPRRTYIRRSNTLDNTDAICYWNLSVIGNRSERWTFRDFQQAWKLPRRTSRRNTTQKQEDTTSVLLRKRGKYPMGQCHYKGTSLIRNAWPHSTWRKRW